MAVHIYTQTIQRTIQITTNVEECGPCPVFAGFTLEFALQLRKKHGKTSVRVRKTSVRLRKTSVRVQYTYYQNTHTLQNFSHGLMKRHFYDGTRAIPLASGIVRRTDGISVDMLHFGVSLYIQSCITVQGYADTLQY